LPKRAEWFLEELVAAGATGVTTIAYPGVRIGDCIHKLRKAGIDVRTVYEPHDGEFRGRHGRYFLKSKVERVTTFPISGKPDQQNDGQPSQGAT
jgi:hypothetical protein